MHAWEHARPAPASLILVHGWGVGARRLQTILERMLDELSFEAPEVGRHGEFNFLLSNGAFLFAHCASRLTYIVRQAPFASAHLKDQDISVDFRELTRPGDRVAVVATTPLTDNESWTPLPAGTLMLFVDGALRAGPVTTCAFTPANPPSA